MTLNNNNQICLMSYQVKAIRSRLDFLDCSIEDKLLNKYSTWCIEDLASVEYDAIISDIENFTKELKGL